MTRPGGGWLVVLAALVGCGGGGAGGASDAGLGGGDDAARDRPPGAADPASSDREPPATTRETTGEQGVCFVCDRDYFCDGTAFGATIVGYRLHVTPGTRVPGACDSTADTELDTRPFGPGTSHIGPPFAVEPCGAAYSSDAGFLYSITPTSTRSFRLLYAVGGGADLMCKAGP
jgi:hypothetical protein